MEEDRKTAGINVTKIIRNIKKCLNFLIWYDKIRMLCNKQSAMSSTW